MATIIDVAKQAKVSKSTVSRVISGNGYVSKESREKVLVAMENLSYTPNSIARNLQSGKTKTIGFIAQNFIEPLSIFLEEFISIAKQYNYQVILYFIDNDKQKEIEALNQMKYKQIDAIFILTKVNSWAVIESYSQYGPIATWHRIDSDSIYSSYVDHYSGYLRSLKYLYSRGYQDVGHVLGNPENLNTQARIRAIEEFKKQTGCSVQNNWFFYAEDRQNNGQKIAHKWAKMKNKTHAMAFYSDFVAAEFISELELLHYEVPKNVAVMGFDNSEISQLMHITTVDYSIKRQAENSFIYLYNQLNEKQLHEKKMTIHLIERKTVPFKSMINQNT